MQTHTLIILYTGWLVVRENIVLNDFPKLILKLKFVVFWYYYNNIMGRFEKF